MHPGDQQGRQHCITLRDWACTSAAFLGMRFNTFSWLHLAAAAAVALAQLHEQVARGQNLHRHRSQCGIGVRDIKGMQLANVIAIPRHRQAG